VPPTNRPRRSRATPTRSEGLACCSLTTGCRRRSGALSKEDLETYISVQIERDGPQTASIRFGDLQQFFKWPVEEREIDHPPMANMKRPHVPEGHLPREP
jgi:hypothetical protein